MQCLQCVNATGWQVYAMCAGYYVHFLHTSSTRGVPRVEAFTQAPSAPPSSPKEEAVQGSSVRSPFGHASSCAGKC